MTKRAGRGQAPSEGVGDRAPQGGTSAAATTKAQQHLRVRTAGELGTDPLTCAWQLQGLGMERDADPAGRGMQQQPLERLPGEQPAQSPVVPGGQYGDHTEGLRSVLLRVRRVPPPRRAALKAPGGELRPVRLPPAGGDRNAIPPPVARRARPADTLGGERRAAALDEFGRLDQVGEGWCRLAS